MNLVAQALEEITDQQMWPESADGHLAHAQQQIASKMKKMSRLQLMVEDLQRMKRLLSEGEQSSYQEWLGPYVEGSSGQTVYRMKGKEAPQLIHSKYGQEIHQAVDRFERTLWDKSLLTRR